MTDVLAGQDIIYSVSELNHKVKAVLANAFESVWLKGEIGNLTVYDSTGHVYFTLKDSGAQIDAVFFRGAPVFRRLQLQTGSELEVRGRVDLYEQGGRYQFQVFEVRPTGIGELQLKYDELFRRLRDEGLFDQSRKRPIPALPRCIGLITSVKGAAIKDFMEILKRRHPNIHVRIINSPVQGKGAARYLAASIRYFNKYQACDVIVLTRGGGSFEELWEFNEEEVVRAVAQSGIPVLTAVGHQRDTSLCDFAADFSAKTPSEAAELVVHAETDMRTRLANAGRRLLSGTKLRFQGWQRRCDRAAACSFFLRPEELVNARMQHLDGLTRRLAGSLPQRADKAASQLDTLGRRQQMALQALWNRHNESLERLRATLNALNPRRVLARGYAILQKGNGQNVRQASEVVQGEALRALLSDSEFKVKVE